MIHSSERSTALVPARCRAHTPVSNAVTTACRFEVSWADLPACVETLLSLGRSRACSDIIPRAVELIRYIPVVVGYAAAVLRIVNPVVAVANIPAVEVIAADKVVVDDDVVVAPSATPAPTSPTAPDRADSDARTERDRTGGDDGASGWNWRVV